jgi:hypothetical protein
MVLYPALGEWGLRNSSRVGQGNAPLNVEKGEAALLALSL